MLEDEGFEAADNRRPHAGGTGRGGNWLGRVRPGHRQAGAAESEISTLMFPFRKMFLMYLSKEKGRALPLRGHSIQYGSCLRIKVKTCETVDLY